MSNLVRVVVIDDHPMFREGVISVLTSADGIEVVGEGATTAEAIKVAQELVPDVMLLDLLLPGGSGIDAAAEIARVCPNVRVIILTASEDEQHVASALQAGVRGYILKGSSGLEMVKAVQSIARGDSYVAPNLAARLLHQRKRIKTVVDDIPHNLTGRQAEIFALMARGMSNKEIARSLKCTDRTVKHHMTNILQKLNVRNRVEAALKFQTPTAQKLVR